MVIRKTVRPACGGAVHAVDWLRQAWRLYWSQLSDDQFSRFALIGDLEEGDRKGMRYATYFSEAEFKRRLPAALRSGPCEVYGSLGYAERERPNVDYMLRRWREDYRLATRFITALDLDADDNDLSDLGKVRAAWVELYRLTGARFAVKLSGGIHFTLDAPLGVPPDAALKANRALARLVERRVEGVKVCMDTLEEPYHLLRLALSWHAGRRCFAIPLRPSELAGSIEELRAKAADPEEVSKRIALAYRRPELLKGCVDDAELFAKALDLLTPCGLDLRPEVTTLCAHAPSRTHGGWRRAYVEGVGEISYHPKLEGFGWAVTIVKELIPLSDGRLTFAWAVLPVLVKGPKVRGPDGKPRPLPPMITEDEARRWLERCVNAYPDKPLEAYEDKLSRNMRYHYNVPTWRSLLKGEGSGPITVSLQALLPAILEALERAGYVRRC